jgi:hypothetical protein
MHTAFPGICGPLGLDGSGLRPMAAPGSDDAPVAWSLDGRRSFVYGAGGSFIVNLATGTLSQVARITGTGGIAWTP